MIDFSVPPELEAIRQRTTAFMEEFVYPNESKLVEDEGLPADLETELQKRVKALGLWAPNLPAEWGGMGIGYIGQALMNEIVGRSVIAPRLFGNAAPDVRQCGAPRPQGARQRKEFDIASKRARRPRSQKSLTLDG